jgi:hypothetical protein
LRAFKRHLIGKRGAGARRRRNDGAEIARALPIEFVAENGKGRGYAFSDIRLISMSRSTGSAGPADGFMSELPYALTSVEKEVEKSIFVTSTRLQNVPCIPA